MTDSVGLQIQRHAFGRPAGYRKLALVARPVHWAPQWARILTKPLRRLRERPQSRELTKDFRNWFRVQASGSIGPICLTGAGLAHARPSSAMSPAGYSLASLSSKRLRFADRLISWPRSGFESTGKYSVPVGSSDPPPMAAGADYKTGGNAALLNRR